MKSLPVRRGVEVGDVRSPKPCSNGFPGGRVSDGRDALGMYVSRFELPPEPFDRIVLERAPGNGDWYVAAASPTPNGGRLI